MSALSSVFAISSLLAVEGCSWKQRSTVVATSRLKSLAPAICRAGKSVAGGRQGEVAGGVGSSSARRGRFVMLLLLCLVCTEGAQECPELPTCCSRTLES
jgi:hypothetical protein